MRKYRFPFFLIAGLCVAGISLAQEDFPNIYKQKNLLVRN